jgi:hypothetical protein
MNIVHTELTCPAIITLTIAYFQPSWLPGEPGIAGALLVIAPGRYCRPYGLASISDNVIIPASAGHWHIHTYIHTGTDPMFAAHT